MKWTWDWKRKVVSKRNSEGVFQESSLEIQCVTKRMWIWLINVGLRIIILFLQRAFKTKSFHNTGGEKNVNQVKLCVCGERREPGEGVDSSPVCLTWDQPLGLFGDLRSMRVGWDVGRAHWVCALLFALLVAFSFSVALELVLKISNHHSCGFLFTTSTWCWLLVFSPSLRLWTKHCGIVLLFKMYH